VRGTPQSADSCQRQGVSKEAVVSFPSSLRRNPSRRLSRAGAAPRLGALVLTLGLMVSLAGVAGNSPASAVTLLAGSPYDGTDGAPDASAGALSPDMTSGQLDNSYGGGVKEVTVCPPVTTGSIPPKADLVGVYVATAVATDGSGDHFLYLAWERLDTANEAGTVAIDFELNQSADLCANGVNPDRTVGDKLVTYEFQGDLPAPAVEITVWTWDGTKWGDETVLTLTQAEGSIATDRLFGEMVINLEKSGIFTKGQCDNFAGVFAKSRSSSSSEEPQLKDLIAPVPLHVANCGPLTVSKTVTGGKAGDTFDFTVDCPNDKNDASFSLADGDSKTLEDIPVGDECVVTEAAPGAFWTTTHTIGGVTGSGPATLVMDAEGQSVAFTNAAKPNGITLDKKLNGADHATIGDALVARTLDDLTYTVTVTNTGQVPLTITALEDSLYTGFPAAGDCPQGVGSTLAAGASFTCTYHVSMAGAAHNVAEVIAVDQSNRQVSDDDETFVSVPVEVLGIVLAQPEPAAVLPAVLPRTGTQTRDMALLASGLAGLGLGLLRLGRRSKKTG
jgi:uncharacterized repeat protein (TIGR01451 family)/LPXTG-motif cell wall-anchored protein